jgi:acetyl-CoA C-acetyltransferase
MAQSPQDVIVAGIGSTEVGEHWELSLREIALSAMHQAIRDSSGLLPTALYVGNMLAPVLSGQAHLGALLADYAGLGGIEAVTIEDGGASGGAALRNGYMAVASGLVDVALVVGVEKITDQIGSTIDSALSTNMDSDFEAPQGLTLNAQAALIMQRYLHHYNTPHEAFAGFAINAHANASSNPEAMFRSPISPEVYHGAVMVAPPLNLFDVAPLADGAASVLLARKGLLPSGFSHPVIRIAGSSMANDRLALHDRQNLIDFPAARVSIRRACAQAGIHPGDVDLFELYDAFTIFSALSLEAGDFASPGQGWKLAQDGQIGLSGLLPISTFGGLKARGNPGGATGLYQAVEAVRQLRGEAGVNQVSNAKRALIQCFGGAAAVAVTHLLERDDIDSQNLSSSVRPDRNQT